MQAPESESERAFATVPELVSDLRAGRMVIVVDDEDRENEGDFVVAGEFVTPSQIVQMNRIASGIITVPMPRPWLSRLCIEPMVVENTESMRTAFTVTVDAKDGVSTGSSAHDRARTIRALANPATMAHDLVRPGHVGPLAVREGGVLRRAGHTEASHDLMVLAGLKPVAVLCEIMGDDGEMLRLPALRQLAARMQLAVGTIADLIRYRRRTERLIEKESTRVWPKAGALCSVHTYASRVDAGRYTAFVQGAIDPDRATLVRMHAASLADDVLGLLSREQQSPLLRAFERIEREGGIFLYIERGPGVSRAMDEREYGIGAQILADLGARRLRLLTDHPRRRAALEGFDLEVVEYVTTQVEEKK